MTLDPRRTESEKSGVTTWRKSSRTFAELFKNIRKFLLTILMILMMMVVIILDMLLLTLSFPEL